MYRIRLEVSHEEKLRRRELLDEFAAIAQYSAVVLIVCILVYRLYNLAAKRTRESNVSPQPHAVSRLRRFLWWSGTSVYLFRYRLGTVGEILAGGIWTIWLLALSAAGARDDYMHVTKAFGIVGASQLPLHYMLAWKSYWNPVALATGTSWEQLSRVHQILGRAITVLLSLHAVFYINFFYQAGFLVKRIKDLDVILGLTAIISFWLLGSTALAAVREKQYRLFFLVHVTVAILVFPVLWFHVHHIRLYIFESIVVYAIGAALRQLSRTPVIATVRQLGQTGLLNIAIPKSEMDTTWKAGQHVYLSRSNTYLPPNPFTIATLPTDDNLSLVLRVHQGNTAKLASQTKRHETIQLLLEGPYGHAHLPHLQTCDRVLLLAGGVGMTFILPLYRGLLASNHQVTLHWTVRTVDETRWAASHLKGATVYVTGTCNDDRGVEMQGLLPQGLDDVAIKQGRLGIRELVDEAFTSPGRIGVFVCGPAGMGDAVRREVGRFVTQGRDVVFWNEEFGLS